MKKSSKLKKILSVLLSVLIVTGSAAVIPAAQAAEVEAAAVGDVSGDYTYRVSLDSQHGQYAIITKFNGSATSVSIPSKLGGYPVGTISN